MKAKSNLITLDRTPPCNVDAEMFLLGAMIEPHGSRESIQQAIDYLGDGIPDLLYKKNHQNICSAILSLYEKNISVTILSIAEQMKHDNNFDDFDAGYVDEIIEITHAPENIKYYANVVRQEALKRYLIRQAVNIVEGSYDRSVEVDWLLDQNIAELEEIKKAYIGNNGKKQGWTAKEIMDMEESDPIWIVNNYIPQGLTLVVGAPKIGKSWFMLDLALATSCRGLFLGYLEIASDGDTLYLALEDTTRRIRSRLRQLCPTTEPPNNLTFWTDCPKLKKGGIAKMESWIKSCKNPKLVIIDVFQKIRETKPKNSNAYADDYEELSLLKSLADKYEISIVAVHHKRKAESDDILDTISGSVGMAGSPDGLLIMKRARGENDAILYREGKDYDENAEVALEFNLANGGWRLIGDAKDYQRDQQQREIIDILENINKPMSPKQIAVEMGVPATSSLRVLLRRMVDDDVLRQYEYGKYVVNQKKNTK